MTHLLTVSLALALRDNTWVFLLKWGTLWIGSARRITLDCLSFKGPTMKLRGLMFTLQLPPSIKAGTTSTSLMTTCLPTNSIEYSHLLLAISENLNLLVLKPLTPLLLTTLVMQLLTLMVYRPHYLMLLLTQLIRHLMSHRFTQDMPTWKEVKLWQSKEATSELMRMRYLWLLMTASV